MSSINTLGKTIPKWEDEFDRFPNFTQEKHMNDEIEARRALSVSQSQSDAVLHPNLSLLTRYSYDAAHGQLGQSHTGDLVKLADVAALLGRKGFVQAPQPDLVVSLPGHEKRRLAVVSDNMVGGKREIGLAIKPPIGA